MTDKNGLPETEQTIPVPPTKTPAADGPVVVGDDAILNLEQLLKLAPVGAHAIRAAFKSGALAGRNIGGPTGYVTTWRAFRAWAEGIDAKAQTTNE